MSVAGRWPVLMSLETASHFVSLSEADFLKLAARSGFGEVEVLEGVTRWRSTDIERAILKLPVRARVTPTSQRSSATVPDCQKDSKPTARSAPLPDHATIRSAGAFLSLSRATIYRLIGDGKLKVVKIGKRTLIPRQSIEALVKAGSRPQLRGLRS